MGANFWDESGAEEAGDGPMVSMTKMIHTMGTLAVLNFRSNKEGRPITLADAYRKSILGIGIPMLKLQYTHRWICIKD